MHADEQGIPSYDRTLTHCLPGTGPRSCFSCLRGNFEKPVGHRGVARILACLGLVVHVGRKATVVYTHCSLIAFLCNSDLLCCKLDALTSLVVNESSVLELL